MTSSPKQIKITFAYFKENSYKNSSEHRENVVIVRYSDYTMGLKVDELFGEFQTVLKPLGEVFENVIASANGIVAIL